MAKPFEGIGTNRIAKGLAWAYGVGQRTHAAMRLQAVEQIGAPVISIGNLLVGGTGKTPFTSLVAAHFARTKRVAIVSRGYGGTERGPVLVPPHADPARFGDEPVEFAQLAPEAAVWVARDRVAGAKAAVASGAELILLDDGFGYRSLARAVDLLLFDERGVGNGLLLPAGPLREPLQNMKRADALILRGDAASPPGWAGPVFRFRVGPGPLVNWAGEEVAPPQEAVAAAGIAWPGRFFDGLKERGIRLVKTYPLTDHAPWAPSLARKIERSAKGRPIIITGKDAVKLRHHPPPGNWLVATQSLSVDDAFWPWIEEHATLL
jgi:tetraacyldisaccharide 4'-kinase